ncbi:hypothetical protein PN497_08780 [Sphaerospermopsis kisseleviana CS-549]|uniref:Uncharacterized protein n=2 Tax=Sphaerospermopsis TaxID=752201 RepID=A0A480A5G1_9CYAN|nr:MULTISPECIES: hypothetical protein [Sphaerospermopsis]MBD2131033.1 hypothetical protein [Sphaerospermopsis sp. FACHB-1094]MDB9441451.1 hypothetical protein [Sphaerospermopsis kisseleviana CS-549]BAZ83777.1 hypothetical protein NIES73_50660 [Sphaerospermopsis kisseleviana NIES-73]GCL37494.1 hypothetical protein SR1949_26050 [Sphaerospermopsis reniformis]
MTRQKILDKRLRFQFRENTSDGILLNYLLNHSYKNIDELVWQAVRICFMPLAYINVDGVDDDLLKEVTLSSLIDCLKHWDYIQIKLNLNLSLAKIILQGMDNFSTTLTTNDSVIKQNYASYQSPIEQRIPNKTTVTQSPETNQQDDIWDEDVEVQMELTDEQTAIRQDIRSLFG